MNRDEHLGKGLFPRCIALCAIALALSANSAQASMMTWEISGQIDGVFGGILSTYFSAGMPVTIDLTGDGASLGVDPSYCPPGHGSHNWLITGGTLRVGGFAYAANSAGVLERNNEIGSCGAVGGPLRVY